MPRLWAKTVDFDQVAVGDELPILVKWETAQSLTRFVDPLADDNEEIQEPVTVPVVALTAYVKELLAKAFPPPSISAPGSSLEVDHLRDIPLGDTVSITGEVVSKRQESGLRLVDCLVMIETGDGQAAARARSVVSL